MPESEIRATELKGPALPASGNRASRPPVESEASSVRGKWAPPASAEDSASVSPRKRKGRGQAAFAPFPQQTAAPPGEPSRVSIWRCGPGEESRESVAWKAQSAHLFFPGNRRAHARDPAERRVPEPSPPPAGAPPHLCPTPGFSQAPPLKTPRWLPIRRAKLLPLLLVPFRAFPFRLLSRLSSASGLPFSSRRAPLLSGGWGELSPFLLRGSLQSPARISFGSASMLDLL